MINIFKRSVTGNYYLRFRPHPSDRHLFGGRSDIWKTTGTSDKKEATRIAMRLLVALEDQCSAIDRGREVLPAAAIPSALPSGVSIDQLSSIFELTSNKRNAKSGTELARKREGQRLNEWMSDNNHRVLTSDLAYQYVQYLQQGLAVTTAKQRLSLVSYPFEIAFKGGRGDPLTAIPFNPFDGLGLIAASGAGQQMREAITPSECKAILTSLPSATKSPALHWSVKLSAVTGLRINAVTQLLADDVDKVSGVVCVRVTDKEGNKTNMPYWVPIHSVFADEFYQWFKENRPAAGNERIFSKATMTITASFRRLLDRLNIKPTDPAKLKSFHSFRHSTATWLKEVMPIESHRNAMQGRQEKGSVRAYGSLAGVLSYAGNIIHAPLWWEDDYLERLHQKGLGVWAKA